MGTKIARLTKKDGSEIKGYWNGKNYNGIIYFNVSASGLKKDINWKKSITIERAEIKSLVWEAEEVTANMPKTTKTWMAEMERSERGM